MIASLCCWPAERLPQFRTPLSIAIAALCVWSSATLSATAEPPAPPLSDKPQETKVDRPARQAELESGLIEMLSGAVLEGSFTKTGPEDDPTQLSREKYTLGDVKKIAGNLWLIPARIEYGEHDVTLPVTVPIAWAGDTPVIVVDNIGLPGFGTVSARVMFFDDHYAGYWKHGKRGGHLFGVIRRAESQPDDSGANSNSAPASRSDVPGREQIEEQGRQ